MRLASIDVMRVVAMLGVIIIHTKPFEQFESATARVVSVLVNHGARFAVPFFFVIAGYLWMEKLKRTGSLRAMNVEYTKRILWVFLFWSFVYAVEGGPIRPLLMEGVSGLPKLLPGSLTDVWQRLGAFAFHGSRGHLWFLPALLSAVVIATCFVGMNLKRRFRVHHVLWEVFFPIAVFGAALGCVLLASRSKLLKPLVT